MLSCGNPDDTPVLAKKLEEAGFRPIREVAGKGIYVEGNIPASIKMTYCDNLKKERTRLKSGSMLTKVLLNIGEKFPIFAKNGNAQTLAAGIGKRCKSGTGKAKKG